MKKSSYGIFSIFFILLFLVSLLNPIKSFASDISVIGYGPLESEIGFPLQVAVDNSKKIWVLDALKSSICLFSNNFTYVSSSSLPIHLPSSINHLDMQADNENCWLLVNDFLYNFNKEGSLLSEINIKTIPIIGTRTIEQFAVVSNTIFIFLDSIANEAYMVDLSQKDQMPVLIMESSSILFVKDLQAYQGNFYLLCQDTINSFEGSYSLYQYNSQGYMLRKSILTNSRLPAPIGISVSPLGECFLYSNDFKYEVYDSQLILMHTSLTSLAESNKYQPSLTGFLQNKVLLVQPYKGIVLFDGLVDSLSIPVANSENSFLMPSSVCGNNQQVIVYDSLTQKLHYYYYEIWKSAYLIDFLQTNTSFQNTIQLYQSSDNDFYVASQGTYLRILKYNPVNWSSTELQIPSYISSQCAIFIRSEDNRIFLYSWFDSILYSFSEQSDTISKIQIPKVENPYSMNNCRICIDKAGFMFLLVPSVHKVYVFDTAGTLVHYFSLLSDSFYGYADIKIFQDSIVVLNYSDSKAEFYSKKGVFSGFFGSKGCILYPKQSSFYSDKTESLNYPVSLNVYEKKLWIADSGNSRVLVILGKAATELIKIELQIGSKSAYINGNRIDLEAPPFTENGRTLVPLRFIGEAFGATINWDSTTKTVTYELGSTKIVVVIGSVVAIVNGEKKNLDVPPKLVNGRTFVPLRFISESFGASVIWEAETKKIYIEFSKPT